MKIYSIRAFTMLLGPNGEYALFHFEANNEHEAMLRFKEKCSQWQYAGEIGCTHWF